MSRVLTLIVLAGLAGLIAMNSYGSRSVDVLVLDAVAHAVPGRPGLLAVTMTLENKGTPVTLTGVQSAEANTAHLMGGSGPLSVPGNDTALLAMDGAHLLLNGVEGALDDGRLIPITLTFDEREEVTGRALLMAMTDMAMSHGSDGGVEAPVDPAPSVSLAADAASDGWSITLNLEGLDLVEPAQDAAHVPGQGHAHLYLNGLKLGRLYTTTTTIGPLPSGTHELSVSVNTNDHQPYLAQGQPIRARATIEVP